MLCNDSMWMTMQFSFKWLEFKENNYDAPILRGLQIRLNREMHDDVFYSHVIGNFLFGEVYISAQSLHSNAACSNTVSVAFFCLSGG